MNSVGRNRKYKKQNEKKDVLFFSVRGNGCWMQRIQKYPAFNEEYF